jgi:molecular chaperone IbpA
MSDASGLTLLTRLKRRTQMTMLAKYHTGDIQKLMNDLTKYTIGMDDWFDRIVVPTDTNYPPYNVIKESDTELRLEVALAGFAKNEVTVYTEDGKLVINGHKTTDNDKEYVYKGLANRAFDRSWTLPDDLEIKNVKFEDGLLSVSLSRIIPENKKKRVWF